MNYTTNYQLPTWVETDRIQMEDFNDMTEKLDAALGEQSGTLAEHTAAIAGLGNCAVYTESYAGTSSLAPISRTFPGKPMIVIIMPLATTVGSGVIICNGADHPFTDGNLQLTWEGNTVTWYNGGSTTGGMDKNGINYLIIALLDMTA